MGQQYRVVSHDDGWWGVQAKDFGFWWRNVGSEVQQGVVHLTLFETAAEAREWIARQEWKKDPVAYERGWKDGFAEGYGKATKALQERKP